MMGECQNSNNYNGREINKVITHKKKKKQPVEEPGVLIPKAKRLVDWSTTMMQGLPAWVMLAIC